MLLQMHTYIQNISHSKNNFENIRSVVTDATHTILMRCPGVVVSAQVHAFLLGYLSGQLGLVMMPLTLFTV